jgi:hypothetical protein
MKKDYEVGYRKPPKATRFVKGKSGNPNGRPPSCVPKESPGNFIDMLRRELDAQIRLWKGDPKKITKQEVLIKNLVSQAINGNARAIAKLFKLVRQHGLNLNKDFDAINVLADRLDFVQELFDESDGSQMTSGLSVEQKVKFMEEYLANEFAYLTGKRRLAPDHPLNLKPRLKMRPSTAIADDLLCELRERTTITDGQKKFTVTKLEALVKRLVNEAILGNDTAFSLLLTFFKQYGWDQEDNSVLKFSIDSPLAHFIGVQRRGRCGSRRSDRSTRLFGDSGEDDKEAGDGATRSVDPDSGKSYSTD